MDGGLDGQLGPHEYVQADAKYSNLTGNRRLRFFTPVMPGTEEERQGNKVARARHENVNGKLKKFQVLKQQFRHDIYKHGKCFYAVAALVQATLIYDEIPYEIDYTE